MRRLVLVVTVLALTALGASSADAAKSKPDLEVTGSAHSAHGKLRGGFTVENRGATTSAVSTATVKLVGAPWHLEKKVVATVQRASVRALASGASQRIEVKASIPRVAKSGTWSIVACAGRCVRIGRLDSGAPNRKKGTAPNAPTGSAPPATPAAPACAPSTGPIAYPVEEPFRHVGQCGDEYFGFVPSSYNAGTPMPLLIWAHGCGGYAEGDAWNVGSYTEEAGKGWLALSLGGRDGGCWNPLAESENLVMAALADFEAHFNVDPHRVILSGYSSGGDLAYRTGFRHSSSFAGLIVENSAPFEQTESTQAESLAAATTKFHIVHLAHLQDTTYPIESVRNELAAVKAAGFPVKLVEKPGTHADANTDKDLQELLAPTIEEAGWTSP